MTTALFTIGYALVGFLVAVPATMWAKNEYYNDPSALGMVLGAVWPITVPIALLAWLFGELGEVVEDLADRLSRVWPPWR